MSRLLLGDTSSASASGGPSLDPITEVRARHGQLRVKRMDFVWNVAASLHVHWYSLQVVRLVAARPLPRLCQPLACYSPPNASNALL